jgi:hypothetical protein
MYKVNGGSAFPTLGTTERGMTLRDYFAAEAMQPLLDHCCELIIKDPSAASTLMPTIAVAAYEAAGAMLAERDK